MEVKSITNEVKQKVASLGYELVDLTSKYQIGIDTIFVVIDRVEPISMNDIVEVSNSLNPLFDSLITSDKPYNLDISSLGVEKPLKVEALSDYLNKYVNVHINNPVDGENILEGELVDVKEETITIRLTIKTRKKDVVIAKDNILKIRLAIKF